MKAKGTKTKGEVFAAALWCAQHDGLYNMTRAQIAKRAATATGTVSFHYGEMLDVRRAIVRWCITNPSIPNLKVLATAIAHKDTIAVRAPAELKRLALDTLA